MSKLKDNMARKRFILFLCKEGAYANYQQATQYMMGLLSGRQGYRAYPWRYFLNPPEADAHSVLRGSFSWFGSKQGFSYWNALDQKWKEECNKRLIEYGRKLHAQT